MIWTVNILAFHLWIIITLWYELVECRVLEEKNKTEIKIDMKFLNAIRKHP